MTIHVAYQQLLLQLYDVYDNREAANISNLVIEHVTGQSKIDRIVYKNIPVNNKQQAQIENIAKQLLKNKPVQYVLGEAWFAGLKLFVDENVLIPRPETEELVEWIVSEVSGLRSQVSGLGESITQYSTFNNQFSILDVGTGSGCIAIVLKNKLPKAEVFAVDISAGALDVARRNAREQHTPIQFLQIDFLQQDQWVQLEKFDVIVSNPPYIKRSETYSMNANVLQYEPHTALFVADDDPLIFYKALARFGQTHLKPNGNLYVEINEELSNEVVSVFHDAGYGNIEVKKDMQGKDRMVRGSFTL